MNENLFEVIKNNEVKGDFTYAPVPNKMLEEAEKELNLRIPTMYREFLQKFGHGGIGGLEVLGVGKKNRMIFVETTILFRTHNLPSDLIVIENCDEWLYCIDVNNGKVVMWSNDSKDVDIAYNDFDEYLEDRIQDVLENI